MEKDFAVYSLASGGEWLLSMLNGRQYVEELSVLHPDVFLISGGGNDLVGSSRLAAILEPQGGQEFEQNSWTRHLIQKARKDIIPLNEHDFSEGIRYLSKDYFALLMFFHLQYYTLIDGILGSQKFAGMQIITQGYDYSIPYNSKGGIRLWNWYIYLIRATLGHGSWLKTPLQMRGILDPDRQRKILYAMIYLFNEMMIEIGCILNKKYPGTIFHIDARGSVGPGGWTDELHPKPLHFIKMGEAFIHCIRGTLPPTFDHTYVVKKIR